MHLLTDPWIPTTGGPPVGLTEALQRAHQIDLAASGPERTALLRVLTVLAARVTGLDAHTNPGSWADHRAQLLDAGRFDVDQVNTYLVPLADRFDLFDPARPWMQDPRLASECPKRSGVWKLAWGRGSMERPAFFHWGPVDLPIAVDQAARDLLTQLMFGPGGRVSARDHAGTRTAYVGMGPLRGSVSYHPTTGNLFQDLVLGMPYVPRTGPDQAPWEAPLNDPLAPAPEPEGLATLVLGRFRHALLLIPSTDRTEVVDAYVTWGAQAPTTPTRDPWQIEKTKKDGGTYIPLADHTRVAWRDLPLLLDPATAPPAWARLTQDAPRLTLPAQVGAVLSGFDQDRGQTRDHATIAGTIPRLRDVLLDPSRQQQRLAQVTEFEEAAQALGKACAVAAKQMRMKEWPGRADLLLNFWWQADQVGAQRQTPRELVLNLWDERHSDINDQRRTDAVLEGRRALERLPHTPTTNESMAASTHSQQAHA